MQNIFFLLGGHEKLLNGVLERIVDDNEAAVFWELLSACKAIPADTKAQLLLKSVKAGFVR